ncbi:hypothetical protein G5V57_02955 [Nordella sp. HKS 07]|uniref:hypothetical protein n=1 Tax=Nordella sp. HKS 07 TaxID=2712222 RepID=UPI0013E1F0EE|nr:hypothetical protein [Nordella sp. HKS 07]QIG46800.1 hypothetical protein G5V57_02955 [Nordella sp. HKS 07]
MIVEDASRFARHMLVEELGVVALQERGVTAGGEESRPPMIEVMVRRRSPWWGRRDENPTGTPTGT